MSWLAKDRWERADDRGRSQRTPPSTTARAWARFETSIPIGRWPYVRGKAAAESHMVDVPTRDQEGTLPRHRHVYLGWNPTQRHAPQPRAQNYPRAGVGSRPRIWVVDECPSPPGLGCPKSSPTGNLKWLRNQWVSLWLKLRRRPSRVTLRNVSYISSKVRRCEFVRSRSRRIAATTSATSPDRA